MKLASLAMKYARGFDVLPGTLMRPYKTLNLKFLAKLGICKCIHALASRNIAFSCNIAAMASPPSACGYNLPTLERHRRIPDHYP